MTTIPTPSFFFPANEVRESRESFMARLRPIFPPSQMLDIETAYTLAKSGHRAQTRKELGLDGKPRRYYDHVRRVAIAVIDEAKCVDRNMVVASLFHDGIEDTRELTAAMMEHVFSTDVASMVMVLSKTPAEGYLERFMLCTDWRPYVIKACDRQDNLRTLFSGSRAFQRKQLDETRAHYFDLFDRMVSLTPPAYQDRVAKLRDLVRQTTERAEARYEMLRELDEMVVAAETRGEDRGILRAAKVAEREGTWDIAKEIRALKAGE